MIKFEKFLECYNFYVNNSKFFDVTNVFLGSLIWIVTPRPVYCNNFLIFELSIKLYSSGKDKFYIKYLVDGDSIPANEFLSYVTGDLRKLLIFNLGSW